MDFVITEGIVEVGAIDQLDQRFPVQDRQVPLAKFNVDEVKETLIKQNKRGWDKSPSLSIIFGLSSKTRWLSGLYYADFISFTALLNCAEVGRRNRILTNYRFRRPTLFILKSVR